MVEDAVQDVRYALRSLRRTPAFTCAAVASLMLGIGANTAIFSVVHAVLMKPLEYQESQRLVVVGHGDTTVSPATFLEWRARNPEFEAIGAAEYWTANIAGPDRTEQLYALHLSSDILPLLGVEPLIGRVFTADEEHTGRDRVVVLGHALWKNRFGSDAGVIGRTITLDGEPYVVIGVMPERFRFAPFWATKAQLWAPLNLDARKADKGASLRIFARLGRDTTLERARWAMASLTDVLDRGRGATPLPVTLTPLLEMVVGDVKPALLILLGATGLVLLITCANVSHLQLVRGAGRDRELAVRTALGASRRRIARQLIVESVLLCAAGGAAGLGLAYAGVRALLALAPPDLPRLASVSIDGTVLLFMLAATAAAGILFGVIPMMKAARVDVNDSLKAGGRGAVDDGGSQGLRGLLVISEFAMAMVLLVAAILILRSFFGLLSVDSGFNPRNVVAMEVSVAGTTHGQPSRRADFFRELVARLRGLPGAESVSAINHLPLVGDRWRLPFVVEGRTPRRPDDLPSATFRVVLPGYFHTMGIPIRSGRDISDRDVAGAPHVVVINEVMARRHWPGADPIGQRIAAGGGPNADWCTIVGVTRTAKQSTWSEADSEEMYFPYLQTALYLENQKSFAAYLSVVIRTASDAPSTIGAAENVVRSIEPAAVVTGATTMEKAIESQLVAPRFYMLLVGLFAALAVTLAAIGIYGVISHSVARRTHEIGLRMALGADGRAIVHSVMFGGLRLAAIGSAIGCVGALLSTTYLRSLLFGVEPADPATFGFVAVSLMVVATIACWLPGRRAARVDPMVALRAD